MDHENLSGSQKAAVLLHSLGKEVAQNILNSLENSERELIESQLSQIEKVPPELAEKVAEEFVKMTKDKKLPGREEPFLPEKEQTVMDRFTKINQEPSRLQTLQYLEPDQLIQLIKDEHPQTIAVIFAHLKSEVASKVLGGLPDEIKTEVALRVVNLDKVVPEMVEEIDKVFEDALKDRKIAVIHELGGVRCLAELLNQMEEGSEKLILDRIEETNPELANEVRRSGITESIKKSEYKRTGVSFKGNFGRSAGEGLSEYVGTGSRDVERRNCGAGAGQVERCRKSPAIDSKGGPGYRSH